MSSRLLPKSEWQSYFDHLSRHLSVQQVRIEVSGLSLGNQVAADKLTLLGITYEPKSGLLEVALEGLDHMIHGPEEIFVEESADSLQAMSMVDAEGQRQLIQLSEPLRLASRP